MKMISKVLFVFLLCTTTMPLLVAAVPEDTPIAGKETVKKTPKMISDELNVLRNAPNVDGLVQAGRDIEILAAGQAEERRAKLELWLKAIDTLDQVIDPSFDPNDVPQINVAPPNGVALDAGVSPSEIKDDKVREQYEAAIRANAAKAESYRLQQKARELVRDWSGRVSVYVGSQYSSDGPDVDEVNRLIETHVSNKARKQELKGMLQTR